MKKFEYKTICIDIGYDDIDEQFNSLGKDGWELVTAALTMLWTMMEIHILSIFGILSSVK